MDSFGGSKVGDFTFHRVEGHLFRVTLVSIEPAGPVAVRLIVDVESEEEPVQEPGDRPAEPGPDTLDDDFEEA